MNTIKFIPKEFHDVEIRGSQGSLPLDSLSREVASNVKIDAPRKIIFTVSDSTTFVPVIPIRIATRIAQRRGLKYAHSPRMFHIRKIGDTVWYSGEITDPPLAGALPPPVCEEWEKERLQRIKAAQNYTEEELNERGQRASGSSRNRNLMEHVDFPLESGIYEIYMSFRGLSSNRVQVEIIFK